MPRALWLLPLAALAAFAVFVALDERVPEAPTVPGDRAVPSRRPPSAAVALPFVEREEALETAGEGPGAGEERAARGAVEARTLGGRIDVEVRDAGGVPVAGALVRFQPDGPDRPFEAVTDEQGRVALEVPAGSVGRLRVAAGVRGLAVLRPVADGDRLVVQLEEAPPLCGRTVAAEDGRALADVLLVLEPAGESERVAASGPDGSFLFESAPRRGRLRLFHPGRRVETFSLAAIASGADLPLRPAPSVAGFVLDEDGLAVAGASVTATVFVETNDGRLRVQLARVRTGPDGAFLLRASADDEGGRLEATWAGRSAAVRLEPDRREPYVLVLGNAGEVTGVVTGPGGRPVGGAVVRLLGADASVASRRRAVTDDDGRFRFPDVIEGARAHVSASAEGYSPALLEGVVLRPGSAVHLSLGPPNGLRVRAVRADGRPAAFGRLRLTGDPPARRRASGLGSVITLDEAGRALLEGLVPGPWEIEVTLGRSAAGRARIDVPVSGVAEAEVRLAEARSIEGVVLDPLARPLQGVRVEGPAPAGGTARATTDATGSFRIGPIAVGPLALRFAKRNFEPSELELPPGAAGPLRVVLEPRPPVRGRVVRREDGRPVTRFRIVARGRGPGGPFERKASFVAPDGAFLLDDVPLGPLELRVVADGRRSARVAVGERGAALKVALEPAAEIEGRVVDALDRPVPGIKVHLFGDAEEPVASFRTRADGAFRFRELSPGSYLVRVGRATRPLRERRVELGLVAEGIGDVSVGATGRLLLLARAGRGFETPELLVRGRKYDTERAVRLGPGGRALVDGLVSDRYTVEGAGLRGEVLVPEGRTARLELRPTSGENP